MTATRSPTHSPTRLPRLDILYAGTLPPHPGGSAISAAQIIAGLARRGHKIRAISPITAAAAAHGDWFAADHPEIHGVRFRMPSFETLPFLPAAHDYRQREHREVNRLLIELIADRRPDLLFVGRETFAPHAVGIAREHSLPSMLRVAGGTTLGLARGNYPTVIAEEILGALRCMDLLVAPGNHPRDLLSRLAVQNVEVVFNAVDTNAFAPRPKDTDLLRQLDIPAGALVIGYVAGLHPRKRPLDLVACASRVLASHPGAFFLMVGDGPLWGETVHSCEALGIREHFRFPGWVEYECVPDYMNLADIVVLPSDGEGLARVYLEAQALGKVLISSDIPPAREAIIDNVTGLLFRLADVDHLTQRVREALQSASLRQAMGLKAREVALLHSEEPAVSRYEALMAQLVARGTQWRR